MRTLAVLLKHDYGAPGQGESYEHRHFVPALREHGPVEVFDFGPFLSDVGRLQGAVLRAADRFKPDLVFFVLYQNQFAIPTLDQLTEKYTTVNWFCDDQWRFDSFSRHYAPHFTHVITTDRMALDRYFAEGIHNAHLSQWACGPMPEGEGVRLDVSFVGMANDYRRWFVEQLKAQGIKVECFGTGWENGRLSYEDMAAVFAGSKVNLNISNSRQMDARFLSRYPSAHHSVKTKDQVKGRHFEIAACGGFQLTNYVEFLEDYFDIGKEIAVYGTVDEVADKIRFYLKRDVRRARISRAGRMRAESDHTYRQRFAEFFHAVGLGEEALWKAESIS